MKKFKFLALAFAALSFAACSDDVIDGKGGNTGAAGDGTMMRITMVMTIPLKLQEQVKIADTIMMEPKTNVR